MPHIDKFPGEGLLFNLSPRSKRATNARLAHNAEFEAEQERLKQDQRDREGGVLALIRSNPALQGAFAGGAAQTPAAQGLLQALASADPAARALGGASAESILGRTPALEAAKATRIATQQERLKFSLDTQTQLLAQETERLQNQKARIELQRLQQPADLPDRATINALEPGTGQLTQITVPTPSSADFQVRALNIGTSLRGAESLAEMSRLVGQFGSEGVGPVASRLKALYSAAVLGFAQANEMGALQAPDLAIASGVVADPTTIGANLTGAFGATVLGIPDAALGLLMGKEAGAIGFTRADQIKGYQERYRVATEQIYGAVRDELEANPLQITQISDDQLALVPPDQLGPLVLQYLQATGRNPWRRRQN